MIELGHRVWPFINRDLINKSKTCRPCTEFGSNLKSIIPKTKWSPLPPCSEPNEEIQIDFGGPIIDGQGREVYFLACIDRFSKLTTLKLYNNANGPNIEKIFKQIYSTTRSPTKPKNGSSPLLKRQQSPTTLCQTQYKYNIRPRQRPSTYRTSRTTHPNNKT